MARLLPVIPFYSVEAWVLRNTVEGRRLCELHSCGQHLHSFKQLEVNRTLLDEIHKPKESTRLGAAYHLQLAGLGYPPEAVYDAG